MPTREIHFNFAAFAVAINSEYIRERSLVAAFYEVHLITESIRAKMREMGDAASVPIEPTEQTKLLDACVSQAGVIGGGVPGAGGYDVIWLLVTDPLDWPYHPKPLHHIEDVSPLSAVEGIAQGARLELVDRIEGLKEALSRR